MSITKEENSAFVVHQNQNNQLDTQQKEGERVEGWKVHQVARSERWTSVPHAKLDAWSLKRMKNVSFVESKGNSVGCEKTFCFRFWVSCLSLCNLPIRPGTRRNFFSVFFSLSITLCSSADAPKRFWMFWPTRVSCVLMLDDGHFHSECTADEKSKKKEIQFSLFFFTSTVSFFQFFFLPLPLVDAFDVCYTTFLMATFISSSSHFSFFYSWNEKRSRQQFFKCFRWLCYVSLLKAIPKRRRENDCIELTTEASEVKGREKGKIISRRELELYFGFNEKRFRFSSFTRLNFNSSTWRKLLLMILDEDWSWRAWLKKGEWLRQLFYPRDLFN